VVRGHGGAERTGIRASLVELLRTPVSAFVVFRSKRYQPFRHVPYLRYIIGDSTLRQLLDRLAGLCLLVGFGLLLGGASDPQDRWSPVQVEIGGALVLFGALTLSTHAMRPLYRRALWIICALAGLCLTLWAVYADLSPTTEVMVYELGVGAFGFLVLDKAVHRAFAWADRWELAGSRHMTVELGRFGLRTRVDQSLPHDGSDVR
jgi:hypothetical protein